jgi:uncharacterized protein involved in type VI secretion and phage assembly
MISLSQANRPLQVTTPLGDNALAVTGFRGREELSGLFSIELDLIAENATRVEFSKLADSELTFKAATPGEGSDANVMLKWYPRPAATGLRSINQARPTILPSIPRQALKSMKNRSCGIR